MKGGIPLFRGEDTVLRRLISWVCPKVFCNALARLRRNQSKCNYKGYKEDKSEVGSTMYDLNLKSKIVIRKS